MSRVTKPDDVDVLHYRLYQANASGETLDLLPNGGLTLAVQWPSENKGLTIAAAHASIEDAFVRSVGYDKAVGRFHSDRQRMHVSRRTCELYFDAEDMTFEDKCKALHMMFFDDPERIATVGTKSVTLEDFIAPKFWYSQVADLAREIVWSIWLSRTHCESIPFSGALRAQVSSNWPCIKFW